MTTSPQIARVSELVTFGNRAAILDQPLVEQTAGGRMSSALDFERQRRETFVSTLAHELRQPLSTLSTAVEVIRLTPDHLATARAIEIMQRQIDQLNRAVEDILDASRWARGKVALRKQRLDVREMVRDAAVDVAAEVAARGQELIVATGSEPLWADADPQRLHQVLSNLLRNAVKYTERGGRISLVAERRAATMTLRVTDTGRGIAAEGLTTIFDLFSQVRPSEAVGVGVGLSVAREIVLLHDGRIEARSAGVGQGSEFIVTLPLASASVCDARHITARAERPAWVVYSSGLGTRAGASITT